MSRSAPRRRAERPPSRGARLAAGTRARVERIASSRAPVAAWVVVVLLSQDPWPVVAWGLVSVPAMIALCAWLWTRLYYLPVPPLMLEDVGVLGALGRSWTLTSRQFWRTFGIGLLTVVIGSLAGSMLSSPFSFAGQIAAFAVPEYFRITGQPAIDRGRFAVVPDFPLPDPAEFRKTENAPLSARTDQAERQEEYSPNPRWRAFMASELVPLVDKRYRTLPAPKQRVVLGSSLSAYGAVDLAVEYPSVFGLCAALAPPAQTATVITNQAKGRDAIRAVRFFVLAGTYDSMADGGRRLRTALDIGTGAVTYVEVPEGHSTETFRGHLDDALNALLPLPAKS